MATIAVSPARGSGVGRRPHINGLHYIEIGVPRGSGVCGDTKIRSGVGAGQIIVDSWTPADLAVDVQHLHSIKAELHANTNTIEKSNLFDGGGTFAAGGTLTDVVEIGEGLKLDNVSMLADFEDYTPGPLESGQPEQWTWLGGNYSNPAFRWQVIADTDPEAWDGQQISMYMESGYTFTGFTGGGTYKAGTFSCDMYFDSQYGTGVFGLAMNLTGSGSALRGHAVVFDTGVWCSLKRINSSTNWYGIGTVNQGTNLEDTLYHIKIQMVTDDATTWWYVKKWKDGDAEPASYTYIGSDTVYIGAGWVGYGMTGSVSHVRFRSDNLSIEPDQVMFVDEGDWTSDEIDMTAIGNYSHSLIQWNETTPTDTTATVKARWRNGGTWLVCSNGGQVPGISLGERMEAGASKDSLEIKIEMETTDTSVTPLVENLLIYHEPVAASSLNIEQGGEDHTEANAKLEVWGIQQIIGGVADEAWDAITCETRAAYDLQALGSASVVKLIYNGVDIDEIILTWDLDYWMESNDRLEWRFSMDPIKYASAPIEVRWVVHTRWAPMGHNYEWLLIDKSIAIHADVWWICGHHQINDHPGSVQVGVAQRTDHPGSVQVKGWKRNDHLGSALVQGWRINDIPGMVLPGIWYRIDYPGSMLVGERVISDTPGSVIVYGVNRDGHIEIDTVDASTWAAMVAAGYGVEQ